VLYLAQGKGRYRYYWDEPPGDEFAKQTLTVSAYDLSAIATAAVARQNLDRNAALDR
jgi:hypothetical protein